MSTKVSPLTRAILGALLIHAVAYIAVNALLFMINLMTTLLFPPWFLWPLVCWGFGLVTHAAVSFCLAGPRQIGAFCTETAAAIPALAPLLQPIRAALGS
mmetsp:Transcript_6326/g.20210  ORF Transcript_6326/g.20210 Transcript_6326/m.20210 type:complete len:100 (+) Transcript_6326:63-362(+)